MDAFLFYSGLLKYLSGSLVSLPIAVGTCTLLILFTLLIFLKIIKGPKTTLKVVLTCPS